jgi:hypothetical protein
MVADQVTCIQNCILLFNYESIGVQDMKYKNVEDFEMQGYSLSEKFKTHSKYGFQAICLSNSIAKKSFLLYLQEFRPEAAKHASHDMTLPDDPLWLTWEGQPEKNIGHKIKNYFKKKLEINISITLIRSLIETWTNDNYEEGLITLKEKEAVRTLNGHTSKVVKDYYLMKSTHENVKTAHNVMNYNNEDSEYEEDNEIIIDRDFNNLNEQNIPMKREINAIEGDKKKDIPTRIRKGLIRNRFLICNNYFIHF